jgi:arylsulfatase A-like enzyme
VRTEHYKLIHFYRLNGWELYDLRNDPDEMNNVYDDPAFAGIVAELKLELERLRKLYGLTDEADRPYDDVLESRRMKNG